VERPFRYIRENFFLARSFRNLEDLNAQLRHWCVSAWNKPFGRRSGVPIQVRWTDLLFRKSLSFHQSVLQTRPDSNPNWRKLPVAGSDRQTALAREAWV
jgi:hypothetical protein